MVQYGAEGFIRFSSFVLNCLINVFGHKVVYMFIFVCEVYFGLVLRTHTNAFWAGRNDPTGCG